MSVILNKYNYSSIIIYFTIIHALFALTLASNQKMRVFMLRTVYNKMTGYNIICSAKISIIYVKYINQVKLF